MRILILTSSGLNDERVRGEIIKNLPKPSPGTTVAYITTAAHPEANKKFVQRDRQQLLALGFSVEDLDIEGKNEAQLRHLLKGKNLIYVQGGNTFYLLKTVRESGFDKLMPEFLSSGVVYLGASAGSYLACPTIEMAAWKHQDRNRFGLTDLNALNLVPFLISVHYQPEYREILQQASKNSTYPLKILTDHQALIVKDESVELIGDPQEIKL